MTTQMMDALRKLAELGKLIEDKLGPAWRNVPWQRPNRHPHSFKFVSLPEGSFLPCPCGVASRFSPGDLTGFEAVVDDTVQVNTSMVSVNVVGLVRHEYCGMVIMQISPCQSSKEGK